MLMFIKWTFHNSIIEFELLLNFHNATVISGGVLLNVKQYFTGPLIQASRVKI